MSFASKQLYILHPDTVHHHINHKDCITNLEHCLLTSVVHPYQLHRVRNSEDQTLINHALALVDIYYKHSVIST